MTTERKRSGQSRKRRRVTGSRPEETRPRIKGPSSQMFFDYLTFQIKVHPIGQFLLPSESVTRFLKRLRAFRIELEKGEDASQHRRAADKPVLILVRRGLIELSCGSAAFAPRRQVGPGLVFGEAPLLGMETFGARAVAAEDSQVFVIKSKPLQEVMYDSPVLARRWLNQISRMTSFAERQRRMILFGSAEIRLAALLLDLTAGGQPILNVTRMELAQRLGVYRETLSLVFKSLKQKRVVRGKRSAIEILNRRKLERMIEPFVE
ncbi:MAG: Crp/Fnr family transcriptional regulator [Blastocatellia bacterium]